MLYTLSQSHYDMNELSELFSHLTEVDAVLLWQDGVLQAVKNPAFFANLDTVFVLSEDLTARGLSTTLPVISLKQLVGITEQYTPQVAL